MKWYYSDGVKQMGPVDDDRFRELIKSGEINETTLIWRSGMPDWQPLRQLDLSGLIDISTGSGDVSEPVETVITQVETNAASCSECGRTFPTEDMIPYGDIWVCASCKPLFVQKLKEGGSVSGRLRYGGFWIRFAAKFVDGLILGVVNFVLSFLGGFFMSEPPADPSQVMMPLMMMSGIFLFQVLIAAAFTTFFLGRYGATPGKMACKLQVVLADGSRISYARALGRHFAEMISYMILCIGYIMAAFDEEKRTLHDRICDTRVVKI